MSQTTAPAGGGGRIRGVSEEYIRGGEPAGTQGHEKSTAAETLARAALRSGIVFLVLHVSHAITSDPFAAAADGPLDRSAPSSAALALKRGWDAHLAIDSARADIDPWSGAAGSAARSGSEQDCRIGRYAPRSESVLPI